MSLTESLPQRPQHTLTAHRGAVNACTFTTTGSYLLTGGQDRTIQLWNIATGDNVSVFHGHGWAVHDIAVAPTDTRFASGGGDRGVFLWDVVTCRVLRKWTGHTQRTNTVQFNAQGTVLASGSFDTTVQLWDCRSSAARPIQVLDDAKDSVTCIDINDHEVMAASVDGSCRIYDLRTGTLLTDYVGSPLSSCAFSKDNQCILLSVLDSTLRLVDRSNGSLLNQ
ncbi:WD repeat-containing protein 83 [Dimargaris verticillata]|uniref:WD repeat-containing protein 83 n=1 Tax=Dimargaris verticillata TaxID=2761393 RepID=A0A9W8BBD3_9FUNG|nr:WD repeat-containing protein 83 [Dimargaris verticillata]